MKIKVLWSSIKWVFNPLSLSAGFLLSLARLQGFVSAVLFCLVGCFAASLIVFMIRRDEWKQPITPE